MTKEELMKVLKDWKPELELMAKYNDNSIDYQRYSALESAIKVLEPCEDAISRQAVLEIQTKYSEHLGATKFWQMRDDIKALSSVTPKPKTGWIPVSKRLPENTQPVLMTIRRMSKLYKHEPFITVGYISWNQATWWCAHDGDCVRNEIEVLAWMPLPEPYTVESEDKE